MTGEITVSQFNERVKGLLGSADMLHDISVVGEISEYKTASSGHVYLTLKDRDSAVSCTLFRSAASRLSFRPAVGMKVVAFGSVSFYSPRGSLGFNILGMAPYGKGEQQKALEELTAKLLKEGLFDPERKRQVPRYPKVIGVVTSRTGAVIRDIIDTASRRFPADILLAPAQVQGEGADVSIVKGIELLNREGVDVIIVGRGGGSADDLSAFNSEIVVRAVCASRAPVISAVGHAIDKSLTDRAADRYAETPTMAATIAVPELEGEMRRVDALDMRMSSSLNAVLERMRSRFGMYDSRLRPESALREISGKRSQVEALWSAAGSVVSRKVSGASSSFARADSRLDPSRAADAIARLREALASIDARVSASASLAMERRASALSALSDRLRSDDPSNVLGRGYSYITDGSGRAVGSAVQLSPGTTVTVRMKDGSAKAEIQEVSIDG